MNNESAYWQRAYSMSATDGLDSFTVSKHSGSDWSGLAFAINGATAQRVTIRSREMAEQLHFMLGQMLHGQMAL